MIKSITFFLLFIYSYNSIAQEISIDQHLLDTISVKFVNDNIYDQIEKKLPENLELKGWTKLYLYKSYKALVKRENDSAVFYAKKGIEFYEKETAVKSARKVLHKLYYIKGLREYFEGDIQGSLQTLNMGLSFTDGFTKGRDDTSWKFYILERIGIIHLEKGDYQLAVEVTKEKLKDTFYMSFKYDAGNTYRDIGNIYMEYVKNSDSAAYYFEKAITSFENPTQADFWQTDENSYYTSFASTYTSYGDLLYTLNKKERAIEFYKKSNDILDTKKLKETVSKTKTDFFIRTNNALLLSKNGESKKAIKILSTVLDSIKNDTIYSRNERSLRLKVHNFISDIQNQEGNYKEAYISQQELNNYLLAYNEANISRQLQKFSTQYEVREKDLSIANLEASNRQKEQIVKQQNLINWILAGLILTIIGIGFLFFKQRKQREKYRTANLEQRLLRSQLNPHFLFNALNTASNLAHQKSDETISYISKLGTLLRSVLENSREEFITLEEEVDTLESYLALHSDFSSKFEYKIQVSNTIDKEEVLIPPMFIQPFVENAIQHGLQRQKDDKIVIQFSIDQKTLCCTIEDNGIGNSNTLNAKKEHQSLSGTILKERLALYAKRFKTKASYTITDLSNEESQGTRVVLYLPLIENE